MNVDASSSRPVSELALPPSETTRSVRKAAVIAGVALLALAVFAAFGYPFAIRRLVTDGDAATTAADIAGSATLFRLGILSLFLAFSLDIVAAWALYYVFRPANDGLSMFAAWLRVAYAAIALVAVGHLVGVLRLLETDEYQSAFGVGQSQAQALLRVQTFTDIWDAGLVLFGLYLLVIAFLAYRSGYVPRLLAGLLALSGAGYVFDSVGAVISRGSGPDISAVTFVGEFLFALWLIVYGRRIALPAAVRGP